MKSCRCCKNRRGCCRDYTDYSIHGGFNKFKMQSSGLLAGHTFTDWLCLLLTEKDYVYSILQATAERNIENLKLYFEAVGDCIDTVLISTTDYGTQKGELINPQIFKELYLPNMKRVNDYVHSQGKIKTMYHTCGSVRKLDRVLHPGRRGHFEPLAGQHREHGPAGAETGVRRADCFLGRRH